MTTLHLRKSRGRSPLRLGLLLIPLVLASLAVPPRAQAIDLGPNGDSSGACIPAAVGLVSWRAGDEDSSDLQGNNDGILNNGASYAAAPPTIELLVPTYDYPEAGVSNTIGRAIANNGTIAGTVTTPITSGYERFSDGTFSQTFVFPGAQATYAQGVNNSNLVCGTYYTISTEIAHGFFYDGLVFTQYDVPGETYTAVTGINDAGDFCGYAYQVTSEDGTGFINVGGALEFFTVPGTRGIFPTGVNNLRQVVGYYFDRHSRVHGFFRDADNTLTYPIDPPGSVSTLIWGINDKGVVVGSYSTDTAAYAFVLKLTHSLISYVYPDPEASSVAFRGINNSRTITGSYHDDANFTFHSFIAQPVR